MKVNKGSGIKTMAGIDHMLRGHPCNGCRIAAMGCKDDGSIEYTCSSGSLHNYKSVEVKRKCKKFPKG